MIGQTARAVAPGRESGDVNPGLNAQLSNPSNAAGIYCVSVADPGDLSTDVLFVVRIVHT